MRVMLPTARQSRQVGSLRVVTTSLGDLFPAWREIEILGS